MIAQNEAEFQKAGITAWHEAGYKGQGIRVAVLDTPVYIADYMAATGKYHDPLNQHKDSNGNIDGGHCASVAKVIHEVAPEAEIYMMGHLSGFEYVKEHPDEFDLVNISMSFAANKRDDIGLPVTYAAGNNGNLEAWDEGSKKDTPWIVVGAWEEAGDCRAAYSNGGENLTCVGYSNIYTPTKYPNYYGQFNGTSCSAPFVCGQLALLMSKVGKLSLAECKEFIAANCRDVKEPGKDDASGYGLFVLPDPEEVEALKIVLTLGSKTAVVDGVEHQLDVAPFAENGRTFVPIRFVAETLGCKVDYDNATKTVTIEK